MARHATWIWLAVVGLVGCAGAQVPQDTPVAAARVKLLAGRGASATVRALQTKPSLRLEVQDPAPLLEQRAGPAPEDDVRREARAALEQARAAYRKLLFGEAVSLLSRAQAALAGVARTTEDFALLARLAVQRGLNQLALKQEEAARETFATAFHLGYAGPEPGQLPPEEEGRMRAVQDGLAGATRSGLTVVAQPAGAEVWIDGKTRGPAPVTAQLAPGLHHLRVVRLGHRSRAFFHLLAPGKSERVEVYLDAAGGPELARQLLEAHRAGRSLADLEPAKLARQLGEDRALLEVSDKEGALAARLLWTGQPAAEPVAPCSAQTPEALADCVAPQLYALATGHPPRQLQVAAAAPFYRRWWFWTLIAAGVAAGAGAGVGIYYGTRQTGGTDVQIVSAGLRR
jgi:hypothetical protein